MSRSFVLIRSKPVERLAIMVRFDAYLEAVETRKVLEKNYGKGNYLVMEEKEAYSLYPKLKIVKH
mgnify:FL=1